MTTNCPDPETWEAAREKGEALRNPLLQQHLRRCPSCARTLADLEAVAALLPGALAEPGQHGHEESPAHARARLEVEKGLRKPGAPVLAIPLRLAIAAGLLLVAGLIGRGARRPELPVSSPGMAKAEPARPLRLGRPDRSVVWHSGNGVTLGLAAGSSAFLRCAEGKVEAVLESGELWVEAQGGQAQVEAGGGHLRLSEGLAWIHQKTPALPETASLWCREAQASNTGGGIIRVGLASGSASWDGTSLKVGDFLIVENGSSRRIAWDPQAKGRAEAWLAQAREGGWIDLLKPESPRTLQGVNGTLWIPSDLPLEDKPYVMEITARVLGPATRAVLVYPAEGRFPVADFTGSAWQSLKVVVSVGGTEVWVDGKRALRCRPGEIAKAPLREHGFNRPGLVFWQGGGMEIRTWRVRIQEVD